MLQASKHVDVLVKRYMASVGQVIGKLSGNIQLALLKLIKRLRNANLCRRGHAWCGNWHRLAHGFFELVLGGFDISVKIERGVISNDVVNLCRSRIALDLHQVVYLTVD